MSGDTQEVGSDRQKLSVVQPAYQRLTDELFVDVQDDQLVVGCRPRPELSVSISATSNVAHTEIEAALEDVAAEVEHTRAIAGHGFSTVADLDDKPTRVESHLLAALKALDHSEAHDHVQNALAALRAREDGGKR